MIPARMEAMPSLVCRNAVKNPEHTPAAIAAKSPRIGCPAMVNMAQTAQPRVKHPSVDKSAMSNMEKDINNASATRE